MHLHPIYNLIREIFHLPFACRTVSTPDVQSSGQAAYYVYAL